MKLSKLFLMTAICLTMMRCSKLEQPLGYAPVITLSNYAGNTNVRQPWIQNDTVVIGYYRQEFTVNIAAPNAISEVSFSGPDTSGTIKKDFAEDTYFNYQLLISMRCPDKTVNAVWVFKATDRAGKTNEKMLKIVYVDTFKISPAYINGSQMGFDILNNRYVNPFDNTQAATVDIEDAKTVTSGYNHIFGDYLSHTLQASSQSGTKLMKATGLDFFDLSINKSYLATLFTSPSDSVSQVNVGDVIICRLRNTSEYALLRVVKIDGTSNYSSANYYVLGYRKITE
jgi:hypothetical protein